VATVLNLLLPSTFLVTKIKSPTYPIHQPGTTPMIMEKEVNRASGTASGMQHITDAGCLGTGHSAKRAVQKMRKRIGDNPTHYCSM